MAEKLEKDLGIPVLRHTEKKPAGGPEALEKHFGCAFACCGLQLYSGVTKKPHHVRHLLPFSPCSTSI